MAQDILSEVCDKLNQLGLIFEKNEIIGLEKEIKQLFFQREFNNVLKKTNKVYSYFLGCYYQTKNYPLSKIKDAYQLAIDNNDSRAIYNLGQYYDFHNKYDLMKEYYNKAIELNSSDAMNSLGLYYKNIKNYSKMKPLLVKAIELKNTLAMLNYGIYLFDVNINKEEGRKYFKMAVDYKNYDGYLYLGNTYVYENLNIALKYYSQYLIYEPSFFKSIISVLKKYSDYEFNIECLIKTLIKNNMLDDINYLFLIKREYLFDKSVLLLIEPIINKLNFSKQQKIKMIKLINFIKLSYLSKITPFSDEINHKIIEY